MSLLQPYFIAEVQKYPILYSMPSNTNENTKRTCCLIWNKIAKKFKIANGFKAFEIWNLLVQQYKRYLFCLEYFEYPELMSFMQQHILGRHKGTGSALASTTYDELYNNLNSNLNENDKSGRIECYEEACIEIPDDSEIEESYIIYEEIESAPKKAKIFNVFHNDGETSEKRSTSAGSSAFPSDGSGNKSMHSSLSSIRNTNIQKSNVGISLDNISHYKVVNPENVSQQTNIFSHAQENEKVSHNRNTVKRQSYSGVSNAPLEIAIKNMSSIETKNVKTNNDSLNSLNSEIFAAYQKQGAERIKSALASFRESCYKAINQPQGFQSLTECIDEFSKEIYKINNRPLPNQQVAETSKELHNNITVNNFSSSELIFLGYAKALSQMAVPLQMKCKRRIAGIMESAELEAYHIGQNDNYSDDITHIEL